jgi:hypothetical protein
MVLLKLFQFRKFRPYPLLMRVLSDLFVISTLGLFLNLLINRAYPWSHLFFVAGVGLAIMGGIVVELIHRQRAQRRFERKIKRFLGQAH